MRILKLVLSQNIPLELLAELPHLHSLELAYCRGATGYEHLARMKSLQYVYLENIKDGQAYFDHLPVEQLRLLYIENVGPIQSLRRLEAAINLEELYFPDKTIILDGKIKFLKNLPKLRRIAFQNRRQYDATTEDFPPLEASEPLYIKAFNIYSDIYKGQVPPV